MHKTFEDSQSLVEVIQYWAQEKPDHIVLRFYQNGESDPQQLTYQSLDKKCRAIAQTLTPYQGETAVLLYQPSLDFLTAFFACLYAGVIAVPAYPPKRNHNMDRLRNILQDCKPAVILSTELQITQSQPLCQEQLPDTYKMIPWLATDTISTHQLSNWQKPQGENNIAFLQYTSGSTGQPKGVIVTHKNLLANIHMAKNHYHLPENTHCVSWLPLFHDMGLIGAVIMPLFWGAGAILMPPAAFLQKPKRFLDLLQRYGKLFPVGATQPNFAYQLLVDSLSDDELVHTDLSQWVFAMTGAEPIRAETLRAFISKFKPYGFNPNALKPAYGMAEATLLSTCRQEKELVTHTFCKEALTNNKLLISSNENKAVQSLVSAGNNCNPQQLRIVNPHSLSTLAEGDIGEIWLSGEHIAQGYWQQPEITATTFDAFTAEEEGPFLRTGDLGSLIQGELFVTGRLKDLLIIRGKNHYPQDIELTVTETENSIQPDAVAAFTQTINQQECLVVVAEVRRNARKHFDTEKTAQRIQQVIAQRYGIDTYAIEFIRFASLAKTSSGKIQRYLVKQQWNDKYLKTIGRWQNTSTIRHFSCKPLVGFDQSNPSELLTIITKTLIDGLNLTENDISGDTQLDTLGLDSIEWLQFTAEIEVWTQRSIDASIVWQLESISDLVDYLLTLKGESTKIASNEIEGFI